MEPFAVFGLCLACLVLGIVLGYAFMKSGDSAAADKAEQAEAELANYKTAVNEHFAQTADHFKTLGQNYRELYEHMARGSESLLGTDAAAGALAFVPVEQLLARPEPAADDTVVAEQTFESTPASESHAEAESELNPVSDSELGSQGEPGSQRGTPNHAESLAPTDRAARTRPETTQAAPPDTLAGTDKDASEPDDATDDEPVDAPAAATQAKTDDDSAYAEEKVEPAPPADFVRENAEKRSA